MRQGRKLLNRARLALLASGCASVFPVVATAQEQSLSQNLSAPVVIAAIGTEQAQRGADVGKLVAKPVVQPAVKPAAKSIAAAVDSAPIQIASLAVPVVVASIGTSQGRGGEPVKPATPAESGSLSPVAAPVPAVLSVQEADFGPLLLAPSLSLSTPVAVVLSAQPTDFGPLLLASSSSLSVPVLGTLAATREDFGPLRPPPAPRASAPVLLASSDAGADFGPVRPAPAQNPGPAPGPAPVPGPSSAPVVVASTAAPRTGRGESALIAAAPMPAQAPRGKAAPTSAPGASPTPVVVAASAAPQTGRGASALIATAPMVAQAPGNTGAVIVAQAPVRPLGDQRQPGAQGAESSPAGAAEDDWTAALTKASRSWTIPPVRWSGELVMDAQVVGTQGQPKQTLLVESIRLMGSSYIWQPWFAQVGGDVSLVTSQNSGAGVAAGSATTTGINSANLTGTGRISLIPASRFPFNASFTASDSRTSGELTSNPTSRRAFAADQSYSPPQGGSTYRLDFNRNDVISTAFGTDRANALGATMAWFGGLNTLNLSGNAYTNNAGNSGNTSANNTITANHSYGSGTPLTVTSLATYNTNQYKITNSGTPLDLRVRYLQLNSSASWRPTDSPLTVSGGANFFQNAYNTNGVLNESRTFGANAAASYKLGTNTTVNGGGGINHSAVGSGSGVLTTNQNVGIAHGSDPIKFGEYLYNWNTGANLGNQTGAESSSRNINAQVGHALSRNIALATDSNVSLNANQNYSIMRSTLVATSQSLLHSASAGWNKRLSESATTYLTLTASDSRTTGYTDQHYQVVTLQGTGQVAINRASSVSANAMLRASRQDMASGFPTGAERTPGGGFDTSASGSVVYQHSRAFGVPQLRYYASVNISDQNSRTRLQGNINAPVERTKWDFEQRLDYDVGRLQTRLSLRFTENGGKVNGQLYFRVMRSFGG